MVFQNVYLFHDTIRANILFGKPDATEEEMIKAAKKARCHDFIMALPDGYDTVVGEGGGTLSGGEKQRISIARAILKNAPIIILDEATASIDPENEHLIQQAISELTRGKTIITIAHRLATIQNADQILVVADGQIAEHGTHAELVQQDGLYHLDRFHNMPSALIVQDPDPVLVAGAIIMEIPMVDRLPQAFYAAVKDGDTLLVNADEGYVEILSETINTQ